MATVVQGVSASATGVGCWRPSTAMFNVARSDDFINARAKTFSRGHSSRSSSRTRSAGGKRLWRRKQTRLS